MIPFDTEEEAVRLANASDVRPVRLGLDPRPRPGHPRGPRPSAPGVISVNSSHSVHTEAPFGGYKRSGIGREMGMHAVNLYTEVKNVFFSEA